MQPDFHNILRTICQLAAVVSLIYHKRFWTYRVVLPRSRPCKCVGSLKTPSHLKYKYGYLTSCCTWPILAEVTLYRGNNTIIFFFLSIDRQLNIQITAWSKLGLYTNKVPKIGNKATKYTGCYWCAILIAHQIVMAKHGGSCVHFSGISTCGKTSRETVSHPQCPPLPTLCKISLPIYVIVTNKLLQPLTTTWYDSLVLSISLLKI